jgi:SAM-dependent methyltransferase/uncharacterized protein YbaR (Trm112 family)
MNEVLRENLVCPRDYSGLRMGSQLLTCAEGHEYDVVDGIPIMLLPDAPPTLWVGDASFKTGRGAGKKTVSNLFAETLGLSERERANLSKEPIDASEIDPVVRYMVQATCGNLYKPLRRRLPRYPIPELRLPEGKDELFLDIGCNWGRWSIAAARKGYRVIGVDPSLGAVAAAQRVSAQLHIRATYVVADARFLPFRPASFDLVFSYSVFQHFSEKDVTAAVKETARVLRTNGTSLIQMANRYGLRSFTHQAKRGFRQARNFEVHYWTPRAIREVFDELVGTSELEVDGYFGLGIQRADADLLPLKYRLVVHLSEVMRAISQRLHWLEYMADSVYIRSTRKDRKPENVCAPTPLRVVQT